MLGIDSLVAGRQETRCRATNENFNAVMTNLVPSHLLSSPGNKLRSRNNRWTWRCLCEERDTFRNMATFRAHTHTHTHTHTQIYGTKMAKDKNVQIRVHVSGSKEIRSHCSCLREIL